MVRLATLWHALSGYLKRMIYGEPVKELEKLLASREKVAELLALEKERRGVGRDSLVFVGASNLAEYHWCAVKSYLVSKKEEPMFFAVYLHDRIKYAWELGYIRKLPKDPAELLRVGDEVTFEDVEKLLKHQGVEGAGGESGDAERIEVYEEQREVHIDTGDMHIIIHASDPGEWSMLRGSMLQRKIAEKYPTIRWNFEWGRYVVVGEPDGITDTFVYEFKTTGSSFLLKYVKPVAFAQADLYGYFFRRDYKRVQVYVVGEGKLYTWMERVDKRNAVETLESFKHIDEGGAPIPPKKWKCKSCKFREICPINANPTPTDHHAE